MSGVAHTFNNLARRVAGVFGLKGSYDKVTSAGGISLNTPAPPPIPNAPNIDDASTAAQQQQDLMRRRRGVLSNIYGGQAPVAPVVSTKTLLGQ